jgi:hypothetical protein
MRGHRPAEEPLISEAEFAELIKKIREQPVEFLPNRDPGTRLMAFSAYELFREAQRLAVSTDRLLVVTVWLLVVTVLLFAVTISPALQNVLMGATIRGRLEVLGLLAATVSAYFLWRGSEQVPWEIQTIDGVSDRERAFKARRQRLANTGFLLLGAGFALQLLARLL